MNSFKISETPDYTEAYYNKDFVSLSDELTESSKRIEFEQWLLKQFSPASAQIADLAWHSKVIELLCTKLRENPVSSANIQQEDKLIAKLITKAMPQKKQSFLEKTVSRVARLVNSSAGKVLSPICSTIKDLPLPHTCTVLLRRLLTYQDLGTIVKQALKDENQALLKAAWDQKPKEFAALLTSHNKEGSTLLHFAVAQCDPQIVSALFKIVPQEKLRAALFVQDKAGNTLHHLAALSTAKFTVTEFLTDHFPESMLVQNHEGQTPLHIALLNRNQISMGMIARAAPEALSIKNKNGDTPLHIAIKEGVWLYAICNVVPEEKVKAAIGLQDKVGYTLHHWAAFLNEPVKAGFLANLSPETLLVKDISGDTPLHVAASKNHAEVAALLVKAVPEAISLKGSSDSTPLHWAVDTKNNELFHLMAQYPLQFSAAAKEKNNLGETPIFRAIWHKNMDMVKSMMAKVPDALNVVNKEGRSAYSLLKSLRLEGYKDITKLYKIDPYLKQLHKTFVERVFASHVWHIPGHSRLKLAGQKETQFRVKLEGHYSSELYHLMQKDFLQFEESYPTLFTKEQFSLMKHIFALGANADSYSAEDKIRRIREGLPSIISCGFRNHEATLFTWGNRLVICNRGGAKRQSIEVYHFNNKKFNRKMLEAIAKVKESGEPEEYQKLFYEYLPKALNFIQTDLDKELEKRCELPDQAVGNCTFLSPATGNYAFILLGDVCGINPDGTLQDLTLEELKESCPEKVAKAVAHYQTWLSHLQLSVLEKLITPKESSVFNPDHSLILEALHKAYLLPLDTKGQHKLEDLLSIYSASLDLKRREKLNTDLIFWKTQAKRPLL